VTSFTPVHPVDEPVATGLIDDCIATVGAEVVLHSCAASLPWTMLQRSSVHAVSVAVSTLTPADLDGIGEFVESGRTVLLGVVASTAPVARPSSGEVAQAAAAVTDRLGFARSLLRERIGVTPACGLAGATPDWARIAIELSQNAADAFADDPDAV
jgi:methionine synthase II (cobalamin-independent)